MARFLIFVLLFGLCGAASENELYEFPVLFAFPKMPVNEQNLATKEGVKLGRYLFYDPILSADSSISCASCHHQKNAFADAARFSKGIGAQLQQRNTLPLFNLAWYNSFFWDGRIAILEDLPFHPVRTKSEMNLNWQEAEKRIANKPFYRKQFRTVFKTESPDSNQIVFAISQFLRTLISANSKYDQVLRGEKHLTTDEYAGFILANNQTKGNCLHCHITDAHALGTNGKMSNNGLDAGLFKNPSLRNLAFTAPYMDDGRFNTLEEVVDFYSDSIKNPAYADSKMGHLQNGKSALNALEKKQLIAFLKTLSDSAFVLDARFSNPF